MLGIFAETDPLSVAPSSPSSCAMDPAAPGAPADEEPDLTGVQWNDKLWLSHFPLNAATALDYFSMSQFYSRDCNNELIKMQRLNASLLSTMAGVEYGLEPCDASSTVFVITKRRRTITPPSLTTLATYYIIDGSVYQAPCAHTVLANRTTQALHYLRKAFAAVRDAARVTPGGTYRWEPAPKKGVDKGLGTGVTRGEHQAMNAVLYDVLEKNRKIQEARASMETAAAAAEGQAMGFGAEGVEGGL